jgi:hypothetical protein
MVSDFSDTLSKGDQLLELIQQESSYIAMLQDPDERANVLSMVGLSESDIDELKEYINNEERFGPGGLTGW